MKPFAKLVGYLVNLIIAINFNGLARRVEDHLAVAARGCMGANLFEEVRADLTVEVIGKLAKKVGAGHAG